MNLDNYIQTVLAGIKTWAQSLFAKKSDIKDMYYTEERNVALLDTQSMAFVDNGGIYMAQISDSDIINIAPGEIITVNFDGEKYECVTSEFYPPFAPLVYVVAGNIALSGSGDDTGEPFLLMIMPGRMAMVGTSMTGGTHVVGIYGTKEVVHPIDPKYLPDEVVMADEVYSKDEIDNMGFGVTSVNGFTPDENGNVVIELPEVNTSEFVSLTGTQTIGGAKTFSNLLNVNQVTGVSSLSGVSTVNIEPSDVSGPLIGMRYKHNSSVYPVTLRATYENKGVLTLSNGTSNGRKTSITSDAITLYSSDTGYIKIAGSSSSAAANIDVTGVRTNGAVVDRVTLTGVDVLLPSSTEGSTKKFRITVDDSGTITATEVTT